jgi:MFS transporter, MHS family, shikimate and dehydroshikimate transport protein
LLGSVGGLAAGWLLAFGGGTPWLLAGYVVFIGLVTLGCTLLLPETALRAGGERISGQPAPSSY